jgi:hypothetical protein
MIAMKTLFLLLAISIIPFVLFAQVDTLQVTDNDFEKLINQYHGENPDSIVDEEINLEIEAMETDSTSKAQNDTVQIRVGNRNIEIRTDNSKTIIDVEKIEDFDSKWGKDKKKSPTQTVRSKNRRKFDGHWAGIEFGGNQLWETSYALYPEGTPRFLETSPEKSFEFNFNFAEYSFGFGSYVGIVTGLGLNFNDYKFRNRYTISRDMNGVIQPIELPEGDFRLSKLSTAYLTAPLMLEFQIPGNFGQDRLFIAGGVIGGLKLRDHTKTRIGDEKKKDKGEFALSPVRWGYTARVGFENMGLYATYYNTGLFETGKGPETTPLTIGITMNF